MALQFNQFNEITEGLHLLNEKEIIVGKGANYGQIVFLVGGAASGKGFARKHFLQGNKFKIRQEILWWLGIETKFHKTQNYKIKQIFQIFKILLLIAYKQNIIINEQHKRNEQWKPKLFT